MELWRIVGSNERQKCEPTWTNVENNNGVKETTMELKDLNKVNFDLKDFATNIVKYQKFKSKAALSKFEYKLRENTANSYFGFGVTYIKTGKICKAANKKLYTYIDEAISNHVQPLTPSDKDKRVEFKNTYHKKGVKLPVQETLKKMNCGSLVEKFEYGVRYDDTIKIFESSHDAKMFLNGIRFCGKDGRLVSIQDLKE